MNKLFGYTSLLLLLTACSPKTTPDASGTFETNEVIVAAEENGRITSLNLKEGAMLRAGEAVGTIDVTDLTLQKELKEATVAAIAQKTVDPAPQIALVKKQLAVQQAVLAQLTREQQRTANLVRADAATQKQLDDLNASIEQQHKQISATQEQITLYERNAQTQNRGILSEQAPAKKAVEVVAERIGKGTITNQVAGTVLTQYAFEGEYATIGKPLYKIGDLTQLTLRAYVTGSQLPGLRLNQKVTVLPDDGKGGYKEYAGVISWISDKAAFTPKTIQTKDERADLVYAIKILVHNDGYLKLGMYSDVKF